MSESGHTVEQTDRKTDSQPDGSSSDEDLALDPRIKRELDKLNQASSEINRLENELDEARTKYRSTVTEISCKMEAAAKSQRKSIRKARDYYRLEAEKKLAQSEALKAARQYQTATGIYSAAKETMALAEQRLAERDPNSGTQQLDPAWQETLNHAITKVMEAEAEKTRSEKDHKHRAARCTELESEVHLLEKKFRTSIKNAKPYFDLKSELDIKLLQQKQNVNDLHAAIKTNKQKYTESLRALERISDEIHQSRRSALWSMLPRMPCVGAETDTDSVCTESVGETEEHSDEDSGNDGDLSSLDKFSSTGDLTRSVEEDTPWHPTVLNPLQESREIEGNETDVEYCRSLPKHDRSDTLVYLDSNAGQAKDVQHVHQIDSVCKTEIGPDSLTFAFSRSGRSQTLICHGNVEIRTQNVTQTDNIHSPKGKRRSKSLSSCDLQYRV